MGQQYSTLYISIPGKSGEFGKLSMICQTQNYHLQLTAYWLVSSSAKPLYQMPKGRNSVTKHLLNQTLPLYTTIILCSNLWITIFKNCGTFLKTKFENNQITLAANYISLLYFQNLTADVFKIFDSKITTHMHMAYSGSCVLWISWDQS